MKWLPSNVGAEPKKLAILGVLLASLGVVYWTNSGSGAPPAPVTNAAAKASSSSTATTAPKTTVAPRAAAARTPRVATRAGKDDFRPTTKIPEGVDLTKVDPTLKLDLLAKVRAVGDVGGKRSLFELYTPPPPPPKVDPIKVAEAKPMPVEPPDPPKPVKPAEPPPPPIPFQFFGYEGRPGDRSRHALFVDGEEHFVVAEGELIRNRYKVLRIGVTSVEVEDTQAKNKQTLPIVPQNDP